MMLYSNFPILTQTGSAENTVIQLLFLILVMGAFVAIGWLVHEGSRQWHHKTTESTEIR